MGSVPALRTASALAPLGLAAVAFLLVFPAANSLPVLGDGALHARVMEEVSRSGSLRTGIEVSYPMLYHLLGALLYEVLGPPGIKLLSPLAVALATLVAYLIARELTGRELVALFTIPLVAFSPKVIWYGALIYMEPLQVLFILLTIYLLILTQRHATPWLVVLTALMVAGAALTKQVGLTVAVAAALFLLVNHMSLRLTMLLAAVVALLIIGPYLFMLTTAHSLVKPPEVGPQELQQLSAGPMGWLLFGTRWQEYPQWSWELDEEVDSAQLYVQGTLAHEARHLSLGNLLDWDSFTSLHTLYPYQFFGYAQAQKPWLLTMLNVSLAIGYAITLGMAAKHREWRVIPLLLLVTYPAMTIGSDTRRYFLYVPVLLAFLPALPLALGHVAASRWWSGSRAMPLVLGVALLALGAVVLAQLYPMARWEESVVRRARALQEYSPSLGGIDSVRVTGAWIRDHSQPDDVVFATSAYEWEYYAQRPNRWFDGLDYRLYFLAPDRIDYYLQTAGARYVVIRDNQLIADAQWDHVGYIPLSFHDSIRKMYPLVYQSPLGDIEVYGVRPGEEA